MRDITAEELSAYLDHELEPDEERDLEERLADSPRAQKMLEELASVVQSVKALDTPEAPAELHQRIQRVLDLDSPGTGLAARLVEQRARYLQFPPIIWALLGTILALGVMTVILSDLFEGDDRTQVIVVEDAGETPSAVVEGVRYELARDAEGARVWIPEGWESGDGGSPPRVVSISSREGRSLVPEGHPLRGLVGSSGSAEEAAVYLVKDGERLLLRP